MIHVIPATHQMLDTHFFTQYCMRIYLSCPYIYNDLFEQPTEWTKNKYIHKTHKQANSHKHAT